MSSDSSDDESSSSDDDLLASPVFKKRDRRTERAEKNKLDFFDACLEKSDARTDVHRRIAFVENEFKKEKEEAEESDDDDDDDHNDAADGDKEDEGEREGDSSSVETAKAAPGRGATTNGGDDDGDDEEEGNDENRTERDAANNNAKSSEPPIAVVKSEQLSSPSSSSSSSNNNNNRDLEAAYWKKIESFAEQNAARTTTPFGAHTIHSARRELADAVSGLDYASDLTDDEGGKWKDGVSGMTREQMRSEAEAKSQGLSSNLGLRRMFRPLPAATEGAATTSSRVFGSREEATAELKAIVSSLQRSSRAAKNERGGDEILRAKFVLPLAKIARKPRDGLWDCLGYFLRKNPVVCGKYAVILPGPFCEWMWKLARSPFRVGQQCSIDCFRLVRKFVTKELDVCEEEEEDAPPSFRADVAFLKNFCMDDMVSCLENDFGLWLENGPVTPTAAGNDGDDNSSGATEKDSRAVDVNVLKNIFLIWAALLDRNLIRIRDVEEEDDDDGEFGADASEAFVAFTRTGLDPHFYSANACCVNTCGEPLHAVIQKATLALVRSATRQIRERHGGDDDDDHGGASSRVERWLERTADRAAEACRDLAAGDEGAADADDVRGELPPAMAAKRLCSCEPDGGNDDDGAGGFSLEIALVKLNFAERALRRCLREVPDWEGRVRERTEFLRKDWDAEGDDNDAKSGSATSAGGRLGHAMHALVAAEVGFEWVDQESESFLDDHPRLLAAVSMAGECALVGACIFQFAQNDGGKSEGQSVYSTEQKDAVHESISNIEDLCDGIRKECRVVIAYPHLRRTKEYLTRFSKSLGGTKGRSSRDKRQKRREQGSLDSYFSRPSTSDPFRDTQDS